MLSYILRRYKTSLSSPLEKDWEEEASLNTWRWLYKQGGSEAIAVIHPDIIKKSQLNFGIIQGKNWEEESSLNVWTSWTKQAM